MDQRPTGIGAHADESSCTQGVLLPEYRVGLRVRALSGLVATIGAGLFLLAACAGEHAEGPSRTEGDPAIWQLKSSDSVTPESRLLDIEVTRLACSSGRTGDVLEPTVVYEGARIVIQVDAAPQEPGAYSCQSNDSVAVVVELGEDIGDRSLADGACLQGEPATTAYCADPVRWANE